MRTLILIGLMAISLWHNSVSLAAESPPPVPVIEDSGLRTNEAALLERAAENPAAFEPRMELARFYYEQRYYPEALTWLEPLAAEYPNKAEAHFLLGRILGSQKADPDRAIGALERAAALRPDSVDYLHELAALYHRLQRFPPALEWLDRILALDPDNQLALYRKAVILDKQGAAREAEALLDRVPEFEHARVLKAILVQQRGGDAKPLFEAILRDHPDNLRARYEYAKLLARGGERDEARAIFERIIDEDPFYQHALFQLVKIYASQGERERARLAKQSLDVINRMGRDQRNLYRSYLRHHPDTPETHMAMALIYLEIGRGNLAEDSLKRVMALAPDHPDAPFYLAQTAMAGGRFGEAMGWLERCLKVREEKATLHALMARCALELGDGGAARNHLGRALELDPNEPLARRILAEWRKQAAERAGGGDPR